MDASQYKDYVLVLLFVKYVSDRYAGEPYAPISIPPGASFADMVALKGKSELNTDLARKPRECLEYIVVHEMVHLIERTHNERFMALMDQFIPKWQFRREILNRLPVRHESWDY